MRVSRLDFEPAHFLQSLGNESSIVEGSPASNERHSLFD